MIKRISALFFILSANIILLVHAAKIHHHYDDATVENYAQHSPNQDTNHTHKHHHSENEHENPLNTQHEHDFPLHCHTVLTDFIIVKSVNQITESKTIKKTGVVVFSILKLNDVSAKIALKTVYNKDPFLIRSLYNPSTLSLRGPPII